MHPEAPQKSVPSGSWSAGVSAGGRASRGELLRSLWRRSRGLPMARSAEATPVPAGAAWRAEDSQLRGQEGPARQ